MNAARTLSFIVFAWIVLPTRPANTHGMDSTQLPYFLFVSQLVVRSTYLLHAGSRTSSIARVVSPVLQIHLPRHHINQQTKRTNWVHYDPEYQQQLAHCAFSPSFPRSFSPPSTSKTSTTQPTASIALSSFPFPSLSILPRFCNRARTIPFN